MKRIIVIFVAGLMLGAVSANVPKTFTKSYDSSNAVVTNIWSKIETVFCDDFDVAYGLAGGTCAAMMEPCIDRTVVSFACNTDTGKTNFSVTFDPAGTFNVTVP